ncbi:MAG: hypothetical protein NT019_01100 [Candidatus Adlerbacteria bacterium]|nr:hypothetical protein [Candidatus Adlerbacteria bacterium]
MTWVSDKKILEHFSDLRERKDFLKLVAKVRHNAHLPSAGLDITKIIKENGHSIFFWEAHVSTNDRRIIEKGAKEILKRLNLGPHLEEIIISYIAKGDGYDKGLTSSVSVTVGCLLSEQDDHFLMYIYPEATQNHTIQFLKDNWDYIKYWLQEKHPERQALKVKKRTQRDRDRKIIELYDWGVLKASGVYNLKNAKVFLATRGIEVDDVLDIYKSFKRLNYALPKPDAIKKVVQRYNKLRKS